MTERQKITIAKLLEAIASEFTTTTGRSAGEYMLRVRILPRAGEPNWHAEIGGNIGISVLGPFLVTIDRIKAIYDLDDDARGHLVSAQK